MGRDSLSAAGCGMAWVAPGTSSRARAVVLRRAVCAGGRTGRAPSGSAGVSSVREEADCPGLSLRAREGGTASCNVQREAQQYGWRLPGAQAGAVERAASSRSRRRPGAASTTRPWPASGGRRALTAAGAPRVAAVVVACAATALRSARATSWQAPRRTPSTPSTAASQRAGRGGCGR